MKGTIYHGIENISVEELPMPECGDYDVILKNVKAGICGTDIGAYYHGGDDAGIFPENQFGHEMASIVYKVGSKVDPSIKVGMRVFPNPCLAKRPDCGLSALSICDECGAFSQYIQVQDAKLNYNIFALPDNVTFNEAVLIEPFSVAMHGLNIAQAKSTDRAVVYGAGMIGLATLAACFSKGIKEVVVVDVNESRLKKAKDMGGIPFNSAKGDLKEFLLKKFGGNLKNFGGQDVADVDLYIDTAGAKSIIPEVLNMGKGLSKLVIVAIYHQDVTISPVQFFNSEMQIRGTAAYQNEDIIEVIKALEAKNTPIEQIITHHYSLENINDAFIKTKDTDSALKIVIDYEE